AGTYKFELKAVDDRADYSLDTVTVLVTTSPTGNIPPVVEAGLNQVIQTTNTTLNGTSSYDPDGSVVSYRWTKVSGPGQYDINNASTATPYIYNLATGIYEFELEASDNLGAIDKDTVTITETSFVLPVRYLYFRGKQSGTDVTLEWSTVSEFNNDHFEIESSTDGKLFEKIGTVKGSGTSAETKLYSFGIAQMTSAAYYRLKQVSTNHSVSYSSIVILGGDSKQLLFEYLPNPVREILTVSVQNDYTGQVSLNLVSLDGRKMKQHQAMKTSEKFQTSVDMKSMPPGIYMLEVKMGDIIREVRKLVKL
ncbi:MAG TPA: T9SS type A sorting domain-containing protein, partial [Flavitalea sp.]|nr:T9SS type A sorting domain-containing protein [Flavitalea sp.]